MASTSDVASHYNAVPNMDVIKRMDSNIYYLRNFNNWMKSCLIADFLERLRLEGCGSATVMDLCCGKGGDLLKWKIGRIKEIVMIDMAQVALSHCRDRFGRLRDNNGRPHFISHFIEADASTCVLSERFPRRDIQFDICSCQFALHYSFGSEANARRMLENATSYLRLGGYFIGTIPNANMITKLLREGNGSYKNNVCNIEYKDKSIDFLTFVPPLFGAELNFHLGEVVDCPEYLAYFPLLKKMLEELGMELIYKYTFSEAVEHYIYKDGNENKNLLMKMEALETIKKDNINEKNEAEYSNAIKAINNDLGNFVKIRM